MPLLGGRAMAHSRHTHRLRPFLPAANTGRKNKNRAMACCHTHGYFVCEVSKSAELAVFFADQLGQNRNDSVDFFFAQGFVFDHAAFDKYAANCAAVCDDICHHGAAHFILEKGSGKEEQEYDK